MQVHAPKSPLAKALASQGCGVVWTPSDSLLQLQLLTNLHSSQWSRRVTGWGKTTGGMFCAREQKSLCLEERARAPGQAWVSGVLGVTPTAQAALFRSLCRRHKEGKGQVNHEASHAGASGGH